MKRAFLALAAAAAVSCAGGSNELNDKTFRIFELNGTELVVTGDVPAEVMFKDGRCNATVGGNSIFSAYQEGKDGSLTFTEGGMTKMFVPEELREDEFVEAINDVRSFVLDGDTLHLFNSAGELLMKGARAE